MKKVFELFLPVLLISIGFVSCEKDDDILGNSSNLIGTWKVVEKSGYHKVNGEKDQEWHETTDEEILYDGGILYFRFDKDGSMFEAEDNINEMEYVGEWEIKKNKLYAYYPDEDYTAEIPVTELTNSKMVTEVYLKETEGGKNYELYQKVVFSKVK